MSRFKFRVWDNRTKEMIYFDNLSVSMDDVGNVKLQVHTSHRGGGDFSEFMQFTGRCDMYDNEIYENDIVKTPHGTGKVYWAEGHGGFAIDLRDGTKETVFSLCVPNLEVIGHDFENPILFPKGPSK